MLLLLAPSERLALPNSQFLIFANGGNHICHQPYVAAPCDVSHPILVRLFGLTPHIQRVDNFKLLVRRGLLPNLDRAVHASGDEASGTKSHLLLHILHEVDCLRQQKAWILWWSPTQTCHSTIMSRQLLWLGPCPEMWLVVKDENLSISDTGCNADAILVRAKLNTVHTRLRLVPVDDTPLLLRYLLPHFYHAIVSARGDQVLELRVGP